MEDVQEKISDFLNKHQINASDEQVKLFLNQFNCDSKNFSYLSDMKSQINNLKRKYTFIDPLDIPVGKRMKVVEDEKQNAKSLTKHIEIPYVSITEIIKLVFSKDEVIKSKNNDTPEDNDILTRFEDGEYFKSHPFFKKYEDGIAIILFYDEFLPNNPIGSKNKQQKVGGFAISFLNLPEHLRDFLGNVHTIVLAKHEDIKEFGIDECLTAFMFDLHKLESDEGVICEIGGKEVTLRATLVGVVADSLAAHEILGFMGPSATYFCRLCLMTQEERKLLPFIDCELRTKEMHESFVKMLGAENESVAGVNRDCILNQSRYFHCTQNFIFDIMHDVLEGQAQTDLKLVISKFIQDGKYPPPAFQDLMAQELVKRFPILGVSSSQDEIPWLKWTDMLKNKFKNDRKNYLRGEEKKYKKKKDVPDENIVGELDPEKLHLQQVRNEEKPILEKNVLTIRLKIS
uniref:Uncharacterized protein n=1 Tax=Trichogramma kaykai TaxID=54128 RepID=A0ABD2X2E0_9HYME